MCIGIFITTPPAIGPLSQGYQGVRMLIGESKLERRKQGIGLSGEAHHRALPCKTGALPTRYTRVPGSRRRGAAFFR